MLLSFTACKKDEKQFPDYLIGNWTDVNYTRDGFGHTCDVKFSKLTSDKLKMEVLTDWFTGDYYLINVDGNGINLDVYTQIFQSGGQITVSGSGYAKNEGFRLDLKRTENGTTELVNYMSY